MHFSQSIHICVFVMLLDDMYKTCMPCYKITKNIYIFLISASLYNYTSEGNFQQFRGL